MENRKTIRHFPVAFYRVSPLPTEIRKMRSLTTESAIGAVNQIPGNNLKQNEARSNRGFVHPIRSLHPLPVASEFPPRECTLFGLTRNVTFQNPMESLCKILTPATFISLLIEIIINVAQAERR